MAILCSMYVLYLFCCSKLKLSSTILMANVARLARFIIFYSILLFSTIYVFIPTCIIYDWITIMEYSKHELGTINMIYPLKKLSCFTPSPHQGHLTTKGHFTPRWPMWRRLTALLGFFIPMTSLYRGSLYLKITSCAALDSTFYIVMTKDTKEYDGKGQKWFTRSTWTETRDEIQEGYKEKLLLEYVTQLGGSII